MKKLWLRTKSGVEILEVPTISEVVGLASIYRQSKLLRGSGEFVREELRFDYSRSENYFEMVLVGSHAEPLSDFDWRLTLSWDDQEEYLSGEEEYWDVFGNPVLHDHLFAIRERRGRD